MDNFIARYEENGIKKSVIFDKILFTQKKAEKWLKNNGIKNFFFFFEPEPPKDMGNNAMLFKGEVGFDITMDVLMPHLLAEKIIILDTFGGDSWEGLKIYDYIKGSDLNPSIGVLGTCASAGMQILLATDPENRWITPNSRGLIHNPWTCMCGDDELFNKTAKELEEEKINIAQIYSDASGKELDEILSLMKEERILNSAEMQRLNFAKIKKWNNKGKIDTKENNKPNLNNNNMTEQENQKLNGIEKLLNSIKKRLSSPKNLVLQDVNGVEIDFGDDIETSDQIQVGSTATVDGSPAEGEYTLSDGTVYVFESGEITEIKESDDEGTTDNSVEELQEEVNNLKDENLELQNKLTASNAKIADLEKDADKVKNDLTLELEKVTNEFIEFKSGFSNEKPDLNIPASESAGGEDKPKFKFTKK
jgi:ATP-dependent protease ClpP protease subunit